MKIGLFTDAHCSTKVISCRTRRPSLSFEKIRQAMDNFENADLVICLGDLMDDCEDISENPAMLKRVSELIHSYGKKFYCLRGNHDCDMFSLQDFYGQIGGCPPVLEKVGSKALIFLNANYTAVGTPYAVGGVDWTDTSLPHSQIEELKHILSDDQITDAYVFIHQNLDPNVQYQHILSNADEVRSILEASGKVRRVIQGHYHPGCDSVVNGIEYHTLPAMCEGENNYYEWFEI